MEMIKYFIREESTYKKADLFIKLNIGDEIGEKLISLLLQYGVIIPDKQNGSETSFKFSFVGIIIFKNLVIRCFPKYIASTEMPEKEFVQIMNVLRYYGRESRAKFQPSGDNEYLEFNLVSESLYFLHNYAEYGIYANTTYDCEYNGSGEILWDSTISGMEPVFCEDTPLYMDFQTRSIVDEQNSYVTRLHKFILTECSRFLEEAGLLQLFGLSPLELSNEQWEYFGSDEYIAQRLRSELDMQFETAKQDLLNRLIRFIERRENLAAHPLHLYGVTAFERVWEAVCAKAFGNQLDRELGNLKLPMQLKYDYDSSLKLLKLIKKPEWNLEEFSPFLGAGTLIPDIAVFYRYKNETVFVIFDAKYYSYSPLQDQLPGIGDISKQYLYELSFRKFLQDHGISHIQNVFLMPYEGVKMKYKGYVKFAPLENLGCVNIKIILVPAEKAFARYLNDDIRSDFTESALNELYK